MKGITEIPQVDAVLLFGSRARKDASVRSDTDICVVAQGVSDRKEMSELLGSIWRIIDANKYEVWLFEEMPLYMQVEVINHHVILHCRDVPALFEYFYQFRKRWQSQAERQEMAFET
ncbi:MAG: nucleotidyltransferase domain-containing protein [Candidatus Thorarchaeota archaeon]|nr:nucleotidyltransferase domain-containing protein [Candidatus Thorarchaeota archaeon]